MKHYKLPLATIAFSLAIAGCRKADLSLSSAASATAATGSSTMRSGNWNTISDWQTSQTGSTTVLYSIIRDSSINSDVFSSGMILVYKKDGLKTQVLPFEEARAAGNIDWRYQVSEKTIQITAEGNGLNSIENGSFLYLIVSGDQLRLLETKGYTHDNILRQSYNTMNGLLN